MRLNASADQLAQEYAAKLLPIAEAAKRFNMGTSTFFQFRRRHGIKTLPGNQVHVDDIIRGLNRERGNVA